MALAKSRAYQDGADAKATLRADATDVANFEALYAKQGFTAMPATPETVGAYLAAAGEGYAMPILHRRVAAIAPTRQPWNGLSCSLEHFQADWKGGGRCHTVMARLVRATSASTLPR
jgi:hypothetical protein